MAQDADTGVLAVRAVDVAVFGLVVFLVMILRLDMTGAGAVAGLAGYGRHQGRAVSVNETASLAEARCVASEAVGLMLLSLLYQYPVRTKMCALPPALILLGVAFPALAWANV